MYSDAETSSTKLHHEIVVTCPSFKPSDIS